MSRGPLFKSKKTKTKLETLLIICFLTIGKSFLHDFLRGQFPAKQTLKTSQIPDSFRIVFSSGHFLPDSFRIVRIALSCFRRHDLTLTPIRFSILPVRTPKASLVGEKMGASLLSFVPTLMTKDHHRKDGKCFEGKEPIDFVTRMDAEGCSRLSGGDFFIIRPWFFEKCFF